MARGYARRRSGARTDQRGMVTAEIAFASIAAALATVALAWVLAVLALLVRCQDTAAEVARQEARADRSAVARAVKDRPEGARVKIEQDGRKVLVTVALDARPWARWLPSLPLVAAAAVIREPS
ncbi:MAG: TadE family type IV pilus minor pilin [Propionicimonas sp.]